MLGMNAILDTAIERASASLASEQRRTGISATSLRLTPPSRPNTCCWSIISTRSTSRLQQKIGNYLRRIQADHDTNPGGWPLFHGGKFDLSASVKAYYALKIIGDSPDAPHMRKAREAILAHGGAERANVFTRIQLALFGAAPWEACPVVPIELMLMPGWFPINMRKVSYWSRTVMTPLMYLAAKKPVARNPRKVFVDELFTRPQAEIKDWIRGPYKSWLGPLFKKLDSALRVAEPYFPAQYREKAVQKGHRLDHRAPERRGWPGRDLPGHGQFGDDVRSSGRQGEFRHRHGLGEEAARHQG